MAGRGQHVVPRGEPLEHAPGHFTNGISCANSHTVSADILEYPTIELLAAMSEWIALGKPL